MVLEKLEQYYNDGLLIKQTHPTKDLTIWNYSQKVQYEKLWDEITLQCRGLVTNSNGEIIARPFKKFFNYEEMDTLPNVRFRAYEKVDGSLGILFNYENEWIFASRGSFTSEQSIKGTELLKEYDLSKLLLGYTYLFEIIYPENRIVVDYGDDTKLILIGVVHNMIDGFELPINNEVVKNFGFEVVKEFNLGTDITSLKNKIPTDKEGYVLLFDNRENTRVKIKGDEYVRLHKIITNISNRDIWEYLKDGKPLYDIIEKVPDEFYNWVKSTKKKLIEDFESIEKEYQWIYKIINRADGIGDRKTFAEYAKRYKHPSILFSMYDNKDYKQIIWKLVYPDYSKPFKNESES